MSKHLRNLTLLHSNDLHGSFMAETLDEHLLGGISMLSGYVSETRAQIPHTLYCIAGDMLQGSLIDTEYKGISTIEIMNLVNPDIVCLGNHEIDYGLAHLLFLERCAKFPIVCANLFVKHPHTRLFSSHKFLKVAGMKIMFIGLITQEVLASIRQDNLLATLVDVEEAADEVERICNAYHAVDVDLTVLLTHIGFEEDKKLAALLDPALGVDLIIGGHSHTVMDAPALVNDILIAQAGVGAKQIGRFDLVVDTDTNSVASYNWELVPIDSAHCRRDEELEKIVTQFQHSVDEKYESILCKFPRVYTHPSRYQETELGNLMADALQERLGVDLMMFGSGSLRHESAGPIFSRSTLRELLPYDDQIWAITVTGAQLRRMLSYVLREETLSGGHGEFYQLSQGINVTYNRAEKTFERFDFHGQPLADDAQLRVGLQDFHYIGFPEFFNFPREELLDGKGTIVATSTHDVLEEFFATTQLPKVEVEGRLVID